MTLETKYFLPVLVFITFSALESYYVNAQSTTPWPELGSRRRVQPTTANPGRDFVSQPSAWNKPLVLPGSQPTQGVQKPLNPSSGSSTPIRDYVNPNIQLSYSNPAPNTLNKPSNSNLNSAISNGGPSSHPVPLKPSPPRDYVNPNIQLSYSNPVPSQSQNRPLVPPKPTTSNQSPSNVPVRPASPVNPPRDYVNPNLNPSTGKLSYSNVVKPNSNVDKPTSANPASNLNPSSKPSSTMGSSNRPQSASSTTPASRVTGSNTNTDNLQSPTANPKVREDENNELKEFSETLLRKDTNNGFKYVKVNYQGMTRSNSLKDEASENLMTIDAAAYKIPTVEKLIALHNNYILKSNENEVYTAQERIEENNFLDAILQTSVMQHTRNFLISKGKLSKDPKDFKDLLRTIWFNMYSRGGGKIGSSGFEHVYLTEIKNDVISGMHNWIYFNDEEKKKTANYLGYMKKLEFDKGAILKFHFNFQNIDKPVGSMFIGTSPEFEMALYSTCFLVRPDDVCPLRLGGKNFIIRTYTYRYRGKNMIGSAFPEI